MPFTIAPNMAMSFHQAGDLSSGRNTQNRKFPANSIGYYRRIRGLSRKELAEGAGTSPQQIHRLETGERELDPEWAARLSHVLHVPAEDIGYSNSPNAYPWATRAVPVVAWLWPDCSVRHQTSSRVIGALTTVTAATKAIEMTPDMVPVLDGMFLLYDSTVREPITNDVLTRQANGTRFLVALRDGTEWVRRISHGTTPHRFHLTAAGTNPVLNAHVAWVTPITGITLARDLPPTP